MKKVAYMLTPKEKHQFLFHLSEPYIYTIPGESELMEVKYVISSTSPGRTALLPCDQFGHIYEFAFLAVGDSEMSAFEEIGFAVNWGEL